MRPGDGAAEAVGVGPDVVIAGGRFARCSPPDPMASIARSNGFSSVSAVRDRSAMASRVGSGGSTGGGVRGGGGESGSSSSGSVRSIPSAISTLEAASARPSGSRTSRARGLPPALVTLVELPLRARPWIAGGALRLSAAAGISACVSCPESVMWRGGGGEAPAP